MLAVAQGRIGRRPIRAQALLERGEKNTLFRHAAKHASVNVQPTHRPGERVSPRLVDHIPLDSTTTRDAVAGNGANAHRSDNDPPSREEGPNVVLTVVAPNQLVGELASTTPLTGGGSS